MHICIYRERETETERETYIYMCVCVYMYICMMVGAGNHHPSVQWPHTPMDERQRGNSAAVACQGRPWPPWTVPR